jgi:hypothetical protein
MMIIPFYFPNTVMADDCRELLVSVFGNVGVYFPLAPVGGISPGLKPVVPVRGDEGRLRMLIDEYRNFVAVNREKASSYISGLEGVPMYDPDGLSGIRAAMKKTLDAGDVPRECGNAEGDSLMRALAFLEMARELDEANRVVDCELEGILRREKNLLEALHGGVDDELAFSSGESDTGEDRESDIRVESRIAAWASLFVHAWPDPDRTGQGFYVTGSSDVTDCLLEFHPALEPVGTFRMASGSGGAIAEMIQRLLSCDYFREWPEFKDNYKELADVGGVGGLELWIAPDESPDDLFSGFCRGVKSQGGKRSGIRNSVIGLLKP